ncbi:AfsA-related hotdog domain-containing protein [Streptomyces enissocaesilis]|uniref:A-factor biosynthesis hotdog domain-containing protein n=1 Tax=Streptomyces enissocaesilis TaxID=332589 RepID=A0ABN3X6Q0_9ACTN
MDTVPTHAASYLGPHHLVRRPGSPEAFLLDSSAPVRQHFAFSTELSDGQRLLGDPAAPFHDLLFPVESLRQAAMFAARRYFRVPETRHTVLASGGTEITAVDPWRRTTDRGRLTLELALTPVDVVNGVPRGMECDAVVSIDGERCGTAEARLVFLAPGVYRGHRDLGRRQSEESLAAGHGDIPSPGVPAPERVGHRDPRNVLVGLPVEEDGEGLAFPVDGVAAGDLLPGTAGEVPAVLFLEASRQVALFAAAELHGFVPFHALLTRWQASFKGFAEPGLPLHCTVRGDRAPAGRPDRDPAGRPVAGLRLSFLQGDRVVARVSASVAQDC